jgi:cell division protein FtsL
MIRASTIVWLLILSFSAFGVFQVKYQVQDLRKDLTEINRQLEQERDAIHVLKAEWSYLNQPDRLRVLAQRYLQLEAVMVSQINSNIEDAAYYAANEGKPINNIIQPVEKEVEKINKPANTTIVAAAAPALKGKAVAAKKTVIASAEKKPVNVLRLPAKVKVIASLKETSSKSDKPRRVHMYPSMQPILTSLQAQ